MYDERIPAMETTMDGSGGFGRSVGRGRRWIAQRPVRPGDWVNRATGPHPSPSSRLTRTWAATARQLTLLAVIMLGPSGVLAQTANEALGPATSGTTAESV